MQRLVSFKLASSLSRNLSGTTAAATSSFLRHSRLCDSSTVARPSRAKLGVSLPRSSFSDNAPWRLRPGNTPVSVSAYPSALLASPLKSLLNSRAGFYRVPSPFNSRSGFSGSFDSYRRGWKSWFRRLTVDNVVLGLIIANVAVFMLWQIADRSFMIKNFTISIDNFKSGRLHVLITSAFSHMTMEHLISNMIGRNFGPEFLLKLYLAGALGGSLFYLVHHAFMHSQAKGQGMFSIDPSRMPGLGASGAVNAIMLLNIFLFPKATLYLDFIIPVPAILLGTFLVSKDVLRIIKGDSEISGSAHLGGAAVAAINWARLRKGRF
ncbi:RHOMBOID-like protein 12, mitochondrial isoform X2 [Rhodamnia argentea]|uniref:RHOMBOID-like protein 12, mitochondrial isoform X2 n=1 Tax=Rhodamnia argentea TaxID=178133 RepID=A0ABM3HGZ1_9MYRT|nr:RHOMBOID-like protein 12, mitochondrial isoform X2 [Rhodamnia argentea]